MTWHLIRLDLARADAYPDGSHEHCYLLRLPLDDAGLIDQAALHAAPEQATVLRSRPDQPERTGHVGRAGAGWVFSYEPGEGDDEALFHLETHPLREGDFLTLTEASGETLCFEVISSRALADA
ncbi:hypothetical protein CA223_16125 [Sphingomonas koreensis]|uniref:Uncharacterized protein n=1 Tax=Sphingomonas koreensis TaxID=93064 RepID=A0A1L6JDE0_9SPHN|nr:hypothetical protein [Sphingomonas koreensis]APR53952.1 hypothetical protein BRX40_17430 [Sphingomonas koreensis]MDC7808908.1 hypothetical protein [Sphingomonas koreensis]RSU19022.1 hypothetical protein CA224_14160 [Sphingomonas koreensis]RSU24097.1 hypothetical protein CA222_14525 [Sphingomonas koreensis]RSU26348.1 hypothetical protein CA225_13425 [Sphingomonas koreensis]